MHIPDAVAASQLVLALLSELAIKLCTASRAFQAHGLNCAEIRQLLEAQAPAAAGRPAVIVTCGLATCARRTPESVGDYASGTNHVLPTYGYARMYSGVSLESFQKKMTVQARHGANTMVAAAPQLYLRSQPISNALSSKMCCGQVHRVS